MFKKIKIEAGETDDIIDDINDLLGAQVAENFLSAFGGQEISIPSIKRLTKNSKLSKAVGYENAQRICNELIPASFGMKVDVPLKHHSISERNLKQTLILTKKGVVANTIAKKLGISRRTVFQYRAKLKALGKLPCT